MEASLSRRFSDAWYGGGPHAVRERRSSFGPCKGSSVLVADRTFDVTLGSTPWWSVTSESCFSKGVGRSLFPNPMTRP